MNLYRITGTDGEHQDVHAVDMMAALTWWIYMHKGPAVVKAELL